ncbi:MAG: hypothetical protein K2Y40_14810 [Reyranella sp.]|nr:hypothetical protein [Reyranella sp.]
MARKAGAGAALFGAGAISLGIPSVSPPPPAIATAPYWNGHAALKLETTMTVDRTYPAVVVVSGAQTFDLKAVELAMRGRGDVQSREVKVADVLEARLDGNPSSAFSIALAPSTPAIQGAGPGGDMRWKWDVTPRQAGAQALTFDLYYRISGSPDVPRRLTKADEPPIPITVNSVPFLECIVDFALKTVTGEVLPKAVGRIVETVLGIVFIGLAGWMTGLWQRLLLRWRTPSLDK